MFVQIHPYKQSSLKKGSKEKLSLSFYGPYVVSKKINEVDYALELPFHSKVHNVFHVSRLKKLGQHVTPQVDLPMIHEDGKLPFCKASSYSGV